MAARFEDNYKSLQTDPVNIRKDKVVQKSPSTETRVKAELNDEEPDTDPDRPADSQHGELAWEEAGSLLPAGWRVSTTWLAAGPRAGTVLRRYRAPHGRHFGGLVEVMNHQADSHDTAELEAGLEQEGWARLAGLQGWWHRAGRRPGQGTFLSVANYERRPTDKR